MSRLSEILRFTQDDIVSQEVSFSLMADHSAYSVWLVKQLSF